MKANAGFTLIEVLIAVVILAGGLLGLAALQSAVIRNNQSAYFRSQATQLAYDIIDRMRSNQAGVTAGNYNNGAANNSDCVANACTPAQMVGYDLAQWNAELTSIQNGLPNSSGIVCLDSTPLDVPGLPGTAAADCDGIGSNYAIKIWWDDNRTGNMQRFVTSFQP
jgi:type IV pilus assembly protein PilV